MPAPSYLKKYTTPPACYRKAPVRRETDLEAFYRFVGHIADRRRTVLLLVPHEGAPKKLIG